MSIDKSTVFGRLGQNLGVGTNVLVLGVSSAAGTFANNLWFLLFPIILQAKGMGIIEIGAIYSVNSIVSCALQVPAGIFVDHFGRKNSIVIGSFVAALSVSLLAADIGRVSDAIGFVLFSGLGGSLSSQGRIAMIAESAPADKRASSFGAFKTMAGSLAIISPVIGGFFIYQQRTREALILSSSILFIVSIVRLTFLKETVARVDRLERKRFPSARDIKAELSRLSRNRTLLAMAFAYGIYNLMLPQTSFIVPIYAKDILGVSAIGVGLFFSMFYVIDSQLAIPFGKIGDSLGRTRTIMISWVGEMALMIAFAYALNSSMALVFYALWVAFGAMDEPSLLALLGDLTEVESRGTSIGAFNAIATVFIIPSQLAAGILYSQWSKLPFFANLLLGIVSLALFILLVRPKSYGKGRISPEGPFGKQMCVRNESTHSRAIRYLRTMKSMIDEFVG